MRRITDETSNPLLPPDGPTPPMETSDEVSEHAERSNGAAVDPPELHLVGLPESAEDVFDALDQMSRKIDDLARELNCLGHFNDDDDGPKAA